MEIPRGEITKTVYTLIREDKHNEAIEILEQLLEMQPCSRAALSLLAHCYFHIQEFGDAAHAYESLVKYYSEVPEYRLYLVQSLYNASLYELALEACKFPGDFDQLNLDVDLREQFTKLKAAVQYCCDELRDSKCLLENCSKYDTDTMINKGCIAYKEGNYQEAQKLFETAAKSSGFEPRLWYNRAVTAYRLLNIPTAAQLVGEIIQHGIMEYPQLSVCTGSDGWEGLASVGNTRTLHDSAVVEALNLKAAFEYDLGKFESAKMSITDLPPRKEEELDAITLHNNAILNIKPNPIEALKRLRFLMEQETFPPETLQNLLTLYSRYEQYDLMADLLAVYAEYRDKYLSSFQQSFFEAITKKESAPDEALKILDKICNQLSDTLRKLLKQVDDTKVVGEEEAVKAICTEFDEMINQCYMPAIMQMGKIHWDREAWDSVEKILRQGVEFCDDRDCWLLNTAHVIFIRDTLENYSEAAGFYECVVHKYYDKILEVSAIVHEIGAVRVCIVAIFKYLQLSFKLKFRNCLANLCVSYILLQRNDEAELLISKISDQETEIIKKIPDIKVYHLCIVNMALGTMYCVKKTFPYGICRIISSLTDFTAQLGPDTWYYVKRCLLALMEAGVRHKLDIEQNLYKECRLLLRRCEEFGSSVSSVVEETNPFADQTEALSSTYGSKTVAFEARYLRWLLFKIMELS